MTRISAAEIRKLEEVEINVTVRSKKLNLNAYTALDEQFLAWVLQSIGMIDATNRLRFRLALLGLLDELKTASGRIKQIKKVVNDKTT